MGKIPNFIENKYPAFFMDDGVGFFGNIPFSYFVFNSDLDVLFLNPSFRRMLDSDFGDAEDVDSDFKCLNVRDFFESGSISLLLNAMRKAAGSGLCVDISIEFKLGFLKKNRFLKFILCSCIFDNNISFSLIVNPCGEDVSFGVGHGLLDHSTDYIFSTDIFGEINYVNRAFLDLWGKSVHQVVGSRLEQILPLKNAIEHERAERSIRNGGGVCVLHEAYFVKKDIIEVETKKFPVLNTGGDLIGVGSFSRDVTYFNEVFRQQKLSDAIFNNTRESIAITDASERIIRVNPRWVALNGFSEASAIGESFGILLGVNESSSDYLSIWSSVRKNGHWSGEFFTRSSNGVNNVSWTTISAMNRDDGALIGYLIVQTDISEIRLANERIRVMAYTDELTGLPNRKELLYKLNLKIENSRDLRNSFAVLFLDIDHFKEVNDSLGHQVGDVLLNSVGNILRDSLVDGGFLARFGGDEFVIFLPFFDADSASVFAEKILKNISHPILLGNNTKYLPHASIGIAVYPQDGITSGDILKSADQAMYAAKQKGRNQFQLYSKDLDFYNTNIFTLRNELSSAVKNNELRFYLQPFFRLDTMEIVGAEALVRWQHPTKGLLLPEVFMPIAKSSKLIQDIDFWMLENVLACVADWYNKGFFKKGWKISINQSLDYVADFSWSDFILTLLDNFKLPASLLSIELTEDLFVGKNKFVIDSLSILKRNGVSISIDDFGMGFSCLAYLGSLPVDTIKIDKYFVSKMCDDGDSTLVDLVVSIANRLEYELIVEGVENEFHRDALLSKKCIVSQGYLFSRPISHEDFLEKYLSHTD